MLYDDNVRATLHEPMQRPTENLFNEYGSFADQKGSIMLDPAVIEHYSPESNRIHEST